MTTSDAFREALSALTDALIPRAGRHPSASDVGVPGPLLDRALAVVPEAAPVVETAVDLVLAGRTPDEALAHLRAESRDEFELFAEITAGAYFMSNEVREVIGYPGQPQVLARVELETLVDLVLPVMENVAGPRLAPGDGPREGDR